MNVNIAFNTIIYIMVFLFPGILFRRGFFSGKFKLHFNSGDTSERLLWNVLFSFICISVFCTLYYHFHKTQIIVFDVTHNDIISVFTSLYNNRFPTLLQDYFKLVSTFKILISLYVFSLLSGYVIHKIILALGLEKRYSLFKFQENWIYLTSSNKQINENHTLGDVYYTKIDIKSSNNELFTGSLLEISSNKDGGIDTITMKETYKFYTLKKEDENEKKIKEIQSLVHDNDPNIIFHSENSSIYCYRKRIKGNIFSISGSKVENLSITFIKLSGLFERFQKVLNIMLPILLIVIFVLLFGNAIWNFNIIEFSSNYHRIAFSATAFLFTYSFFKFLKTLLNYLIYTSERVKLTKELKFSIFTLGLYIIPCLPIFGHVSWLSWFFINLAYFFIGALFLNEK